MTATEYRISIQQLINDLPKIAERLCIQQSQSGLTIVKDRSIRDGIFLDSNEGDYVEYSKYPISTQKFVGKQVNAGGTAYIKSHKRGTWHDFRKAQGRTSEKVNLSYTNRMWSSIAIVRTAQIDNAYMVVIGVSDPSIDYLPDLIKRYGNYINPTEDEVLELQKDTTSELLQILRDKL